MSRQGAKCVVYDVFLPRRQRLLHAMAARLPEAVHEAAVLARHRGGGGCLQEGVPGEGVEVTSHAVQQATLHGLWQFGTPRLWTQKK